MLRLKALHGILLWVNINTGSDETGEDEAFPASNAVINMAVPSRRRS